MITLMNAVVPIITPIYMGGGGGSNSSIGERIIIVFIALFCTMYFLQICATIYALFDSDTISHCNDENGKFSISKWLYGFVPWWLFQKFIEKIIERVRETIGK